MEKKLDPGLVQCMYIKMGSNSDQGGAPFINIMSPDRRMVALSLRDFDAKNEQHLEQMAHLLKAGEELADIYIDQRARLRLLEEELSRMTEYCVQHHCFNKESTNKDV